MSTLQEVFEAAQSLPTGDRVRLTARIMRDAPAMLALDRRDRGDFLRSFYRRYEGAPPPEEPDAP